MFSRRTGFDRQQNALCQALSRRRKNRPLIDLTVSNPTETGLPYESAIIRDALASEAALTYRPEPFGLMSARRAVAQALPLAPAPEQIFLTASTSESYAILFKLLCDPGDAVAIAAPSYPLFEHLARLEGVTLVPYALAYDGAWHIDWGSLRAAFASRPLRAIVVVTPNNPTGSFLKKDELALLASFGVPLVCDEVFAEYAFDEDASRATTAREGEGALTFTMGGLSKSVGLPQMKLAWTCVTGPAASVREATERLEIVCDAYLSASTPVQVAVPALLAAGVVTRDAIRARTRANYAHLRGELEGSSMTLLRAEGGWCATLRLPKTRSEEEWLLGLLEDADVLAQPGAFYDFAMEPVLVLSLLTPPATFAEGVARLAAYVERG